jgi:hypothetical protein
MINWDLEEGYKIPVSEEPEENSKTYPRRASFPGLSQGLIIVFQTNISNIDYICKGHVPGLKVISSTFRDLVYVLKTSMM